MKQSIACELPEAFKEAWDRVVDQLEKVGALQSDGVIETPRRLFESRMELFRGYWQDPNDFITVFDSPETDQMVVLKDIEYYSNCEHHCLPFFGKAHIGYLPSGKIIGVSKLGRIVDMYARRLQTQEHLTQQIAQCIEQVLKPVGVAVILTGKHFCMMSRGVQKQDADLVTSCMKGAFLKGPEARNEFLRLCGL